MDASLVGRVSCGKCVLGAYFFRYHKSIIIRVSRAGQYSLVLTLCEPFSLFHKIIDSLFLCGNVLHKFRNPLFELNMFVF